MVARTVDLVTQQSIDIPRILVVPKGEVKSGFKPFTLELDTLKYPAVSDELWIQHLRTNELEVVSLGRGSIEEARLEDYVVGGLVDFDDISYDDHADLLYELATQTVQHLLTYLSEDDTRKVLRCYQRNIAQFIHAQMQAHYWEDVVGYEVKISKGFTELKQSAYTYSVEEPPADYRVAPADKSNMAKYLFGGFARCLYPVQKFDSDSERKLAVILERDAEKWFKPAKGQFQIFYRKGADHLEYQPDFVAETADMIYMMEPKMRKEMESNFKNLRSQNEWWEIPSSQNGRLLIYNRPVVAEGELISIVQTARPLAERDRSLAGLGTTLIVASLLTTFLAFGIGWIISGITLRPIHHITLTAQAIGTESDFSRRVDYTGPNDEIGQLATTFNSMLSRLQDAYQRVSQALRLQRDFVTDVSHELRTPLTTVRGNLALLRRNPPLPEDEQADVLTDLVEESDRLIRLVNDLLILARADARRSLLQEPVSVRSVVEEACRQARQLDRQRKIVEAVPDVNVLGDRDALKQVLLVLLDNALKYSLDDITVSAEVVGEQVLIRVQDSGPGIPPDTLQRVFDRFYRGEADPAVPGFGLGLPIAKALIEEQGGTIAIESQPGSGSVVSVNLPRSSTA